MSRIKNANRNMLSGAIYKIIEFGTPFITRTILLYYLGVEYLGLGTLFSSILQVLNLAELGFSRAIVFSLFKPLAENDVKSVNELLSFYRKVYRIVGLVIIVGGMAVLPVLPLLIKGDYPQDINLYFLFIIYLVNTSISYWLYAYKNALIIASQRQDIISNISSVLGIIKFGVQLITLMIFRNYYAFISINILFTIANNVLISVESKKLFPQYMCLGDINRSTKNELIKQIKGIAIGKFSQVARNSFDSIVLSMFCGLLELAIYSNYFYILTAVSGVLGIIIEAISAGVGDSIAKESVEKNYSDFKKFNFYYAWISGWFSICLLCLYQPFMKIWVGEKLCAPMYTVVLFFLYFYLLQVGQIRAVYASSAGIWWELRWLSIGEMICNILLNFFLGWKLGMNGILLATLITVFCFSIIGVSIVTFKQYFKVSSSGYFLAQLFYTLIMSVACFLTYSSIHYLKIDGIIGLIIDVVLCIIIPNTIFGVLYSLSRTCKRYIAEVKVFINASIICRS